MDSYVYMQEGFTAPKLSAVERVAKHTNAYYRELATTPAKVDGRATCLPKFPPGDKRNEQGAA